MNGKRSGSFFLKKYFLTRAAGLCLGIRVAIICALTVGLLSRAAGAEIAADADAAAVAVAATPVPDLTPAAVADTPVPLAPVNASSLDFDLLGDTAKSSPAQQQERTQRILKIDRQVQLRRRMLLAHQAVGFTTLAALAATLVVGQLNYYDKYQSGNFTGQYQGTHLVLGTTTTGLFAVTGLLALLAPNPYPKRLHFDTALVHKILMAMATAGMLTQIILGPVTALPRAGKLDQPDYALGHLVAGYATFGFMSAGIITYLF